MIRLPLKALIILPALILLTACERPALHRAVTGDKPEPVPEQNNDGEVYEIGTRTLLWKPISEGNAGKVRILTPSQHRAHDQRGKFIEDDTTIFTEAVYIGTEKADLRPSRTTKDGKVIDPIRNPNGNRPHWNGDNPGATYGACIVYEHLSTGKIWEYYIPDGSVRWKGLPGRMVRD